MNTQVYLKLHNEPLKYLMPESFAPELKLTRFLMRKVGKWLDFFFFFWSWSSCSLEERNGNKTKLNTGFFLKPNWLPQLVFLFLFCMRRLPRYGEVRQRVPGVEGPAHKMKAVTKRLKTVLWSVWILTHPLGPGLNEKKEWAMDKCISTCLIGKPHLWPSSNSCRMISTSCWKDSRNYDIIGAWS